MIFKNIFCLFYNFKFLLNNIFIFSVIPWTNYAFYSFIRWKSSINIVTKHHLGTTKNLINIKLRNGVEKQYALSHTFSYRTHHLRVCYTWWYITSEWGLRFCQPLKTVTRRATLHCYSQTLQEALNYWSLYWPVCGHVHL